MYKRGSEHPADCLSRFENEWSHHKADDDIVQEDNQRIARVTTGSRLWVSNDVKRQSELKILLELAYEKLCEKQNIGIDWIDDQR